ncbi:hypothetical protein [Mucilaginibacter arboris]|uniref:Uncharacterized protein n=1 Tax=Mucilaginibacter arboris TaxID=2682090 RepID=A0A7K1STC8_9SPHI|nr:hypothetical protein [Mucilaginibacter arboris]MVN20562.1 hypothetical protein [Mucilaginibacter arboris]
MRKLNLIFKNPAALTIAKIAVVLFLIDLIKKVFGISFSLSGVHSVAYNLGLTMGTITSIAIKIFGAIVILRILFTTKGFTLKNYSRS